MNIAEAPSSQELNFLAETFRLLGDPSRLKILLHCEDGPKSVTDILDRLVDVGDKNDSVSIGDIVGTFGSRSYGPVLLVPALIGVSPVGGIPTVPTILAATLLLIVIQLVFGKEHLWLPGILKNRSVEGEKLANAAEDMEGVGKWMDKIFHGRLEIFTLIAILSPAFWRR